MSLSRYCAVGLLVLLVSLGSAGADDAETTAKPTLEAVLTEVRELREQVTALETRLAELEEAGAMSSDAAFYRELGKLEDHSQPGPPHALLGMIQLPEDPTKEEVFAYVRKILLATEKQVSFSDNDPQVQMLAAVGSEHVEVLLDQRTHHDWHLMPAIVQLLEDEHKPMVIERLEQNHNLAEALIRKGWVEDAREVLVRSMNRGDHFYPIEFINAVAVLEEPDTYEALLRYFVDGSNRSWTYNAIEDLPGIANDLDAVFPRAWGRARAEGGWPAEALAGAALSRGHEDALAVLMDQLATAENKWDMQRVRQKLLPHVDFNGTDPELLEWYDRNKDFLMFDEDKKQFRVHGGI